MLALDCRDCVETFPDTCRSACMESFLESHPGSGRLESRHALALGRGGTSSSQAGHKSREWEGGDRPVALWNLVVSHCGRWSWQSPGGSFSLMGTCLFPAPSQAEEKGEDAGSFLQATPSQLSHQSS